MKHKKLSESTLEELYQRRKLLKTILITFASLMIVACAGIVYFNIKSGSYATLTIIPACFITLIPISSNLSQINKEIKEREAEKFYPKLNSFIKTLEMDSDFLKDHALKKIVEILKEINSKADLKKQKSLMNRIAIDSVQKWETINKIGAFLKEHS